MKTVFLMVMLLSYSLIGYSQVTTTVKKKGGCYSEATKKSYNLKQGEEIKVIEIFDSYYNIEYKGMIAKITPSLVVINEPLRIWLEKIENDKILAIKQDSINSAEIDSLKRIRLEEDQKEKDQFDREYLDAFLKNKLTLEMVLRKNGKPDNEYHSSNYHQLWYYKEGVLLKLINGQLTKETFSPIK